MARPELTPVVAFRLATALRRFDGSRDPVLEGVIGQDPFIILFYAYRYMWHNNTDFVRSTVDVACQHSMVENCGHVDELVWFVTSYIKTAFWSTDGDDGMPLEDSYEFADLAPETMLDVVRDCASFLLINRNDILGYQGGRASPRDAIEKAGHNFWLTRNGHGTGFWDDDYPDVIRDRLSKEAQAWGDVFWTEHEGEIVQS